MAANTKISPGMILSISNKLYRVESSVKVTVPKGPPFIKTQLKSLATDKTVERTFKVDQPVNAVSREEKNLEFLYLEGNGYLFLNVDNLEQVQIPAEVIGQDIHYLKEGVNVTAAFYGDTVFSVELPQFMELMVVDIEGDEEGEVPVANVHRNALLETGAKIDVPPFVESGDIIKVDTRLEEYVQRV